MVEVPPVTGRTSPTFCGGAILILRSPVREIKGLTRVRPICRRVVYSLSVILPLDVLSKRPIHIHPPSGPLEKRASRKGYGQLQPQVSLDGGDIARGHGRRSVPAVFAGRVRRPHSESDVGGLNAPSSRHSGRRGVNALLDSVNRRADGGVGRGGGVRRCASPHVRLDGAPTCQRCQRGRAVHGDVIQYVQADLGRMERPAVDISRFRSRLDRADPARNDPEEARPAAMIHPEARLLEYEAMRRQTITSASRRTRRLCGTAVRLEQGYVLLLHSLNHRVRPQAALHLADVALSQEEHAKPGLADAAADGQGQFSRDQPTVEQQP